MSTWTSDELDRIGGAEELEIASLRRDGTLRNPVTIWVVRHGDDLYVRSVNGRESSWFRGAQARHEAHIEAGGVDLVVHVVRLDEENILVDAAGTNAALVTHLDAAEPGGRASVDGADVEVVAVANDPDRHGLS